MNNKTLTKYYNTHKEKCDSLLNNCSSVSELILKLEIYGSKWTQWDWALFFSNLSCYIIELKKNTQDNEKFINIKYLYDDIIESIDNSDVLDKIFTNKAIMLNIIYVSADYSGYTNNYNYMIYKMLAHIFKKFPRLWQMNWMWSKYFDKTSYKWKKYHRLYLITKHVVPLTEQFESNYTKTKKFYDDFQTAFYNLP